METSQNEQSSPAQDLFQCARELRDAPRLMALTKEEALKAYGLFLETFSDKYPKVVECLAKDKDELFSFYDFPSVHWIHLRTTNSIESTFATVRLRQRKTKGNGTRQATLTMVYKPCKEAEKNCRRLRGFNLIPLSPVGSMICKWRIGR